MSSFAQIGPLTIASVPYAYTPSTEVLKKAGGQQVKEYVFEYRSGIPIGNYVFGSYYAPSTNLTTGADRRFDRLNIPVVLAATATTPAIVSHSHGVSLNWNFARRGTAAERTFLYDSLYALLGNAAYKASIIGGEPITS